MMTPNDIVGITAAVNGGTGVLFQPRAEEFTYILTAKHVFDDIIEGYGNNISIHYWDNNTTTFIAVNPFEIQKGVNYFPHSDENTDLAIIKIGRLAIEDKLIVSQNYFKDNVGYYLSGFPKIRRDANDGAINQNTYRIDNRITVLNNKEHNQVEADISKNQNLGELIGMSGGPICKPVDDYLMVIGIQNEVPNDIEALGRSAFTPIEHFSSIVDEYPDDLEPILPPYLKCFSFLRDNAFALEVDFFNEQRIEYTRNYLKNKITDVIASGVTPIGIKSFFENRLLVNEKEINALVQKKIWLTWLEFLTILNIVKYKKFDQDELGEIFNSYRLIYSDSEKDWTFLLEDELKYADYNGLKAESNVFVGSKVAPVGNLFLPRDKIRNIDKVYDKSKFKTDLGIHPYTHFNFYHVSFLEKNCILEKLHSFEVIDNEQDLCEALKNEYNELFK